ncbi:Uu.00g044640.m01.CDS01 [Anthostomella pinea]|uniref:Uu.00g044640.m01.CDS01 n=1 Tax=Anthostomella pinea TaxID=933095 RepID=A0AAI8VC08_9PEZI|nr:Uu.00g044640.m01.CDS01 [Anthostomella pinea]
MSNDNANNTTPSGPPNDRRGSVTSAAFSNFFHRSNSTSAGNGNGRESATVAAARDHRRRLSVTTLGLSGPSPASASTPFGLRRSSISTTNSNADSIDESAVEDEESARSAASPFARRMSFGAQAMRNMRPGQTSPGSTGRPAQQARRVSVGNSRTPTSATPSAPTAARRTSTSQASNTLSARTPSDMLSARSDNGYNWSEQLRSRAESSVSGARPTFTAATSGSPPRGNGPQDRVKSVSEMPAPPQQAAALKPKQPERPKPDHMQERILKGDFYMD